MSQSRPVASIEVPSGGYLTGIVNLERSSFDCSAISNLQTQVAPLISSMYCQIKILGLLKPLIDVIRELPNPSPNVVAQFLEAAEALVPCFLITSPSVVLPFLRDLLCVQIKSLTCLLRNLQDIVTLASAEPAAVSSPQLRNVLDAYASIVNIFDLAAGLFQMIGLATPNAPALSAGTDLASMLQNQSAISQFTEALQSAVGALGGCA
jgi:hypothetical protein